MDDLTKSILEEIDNKPDNENYSSRNAAGIDGDDKNYASSFGLFVAICAAALLFGGDAFTWWTISWEAETTEADSDGYHYEFDLSQSFAIEDSEFEGKIAIWEEGDSSKDDLTDGVLNEKNSTKYSDDDCECDETKTFFTNLKYIIYGLLICGVLLAYLGQNEMEYTNAVAGIGALMSVGILLYAFIVLPIAYENDTREASEKDPETGEQEGFFEGTMNEDPFFILNSGKEEYNDILETEVKSYSKAMPGLAYFIPVITLTLCSYLIIYNRD